MANTDFSNIDSDQNPPTVLDGKSSSVHLENSDFISDSDLSRDGFDLVMSLENGDTVVIEGYFGSETPPLITSEGGTVLTPTLVNSFVQNNQFAQAGTESDVSPVGAVKELTGEATVTRTDGSVETISLGTPIYEGDVIETTADGAVNIIFIDETEFAVSEDARLAIDEYVFDPETSEGTTSFSILKGVFVFTSGEIGRDDPDDVEIETPVGSIGIRGTIIAGKIDPNGVDTEITVVEGAIVIRNGLGESILSNQFETVKLSGYDNEIVNIGQIDAGQMNEKFGSVSSVSRSLFSAINDTDKQGDSESGETPALETSPDENTSQEPTSENTLENLDAPQDDSLLTDPLLDNGAPSQELGTKNIVIDETNVSDMKSGLERDLNIADKDLTTAEKILVKEAINDRLLQDGGGTTTPQQTPTSTSPLTTLDNPTSPLTGVVGTTGGVVTGPFPTGFNLNDAAVLSSRGFDVGFVANAGIGASITSLGFDTDGDGLSEFAFTGTDGRLYTFNTSSFNVSNYDLGTVILGTSFEQDINISAGGDFNADGNWDVVVGAPQASAAGYTNSGQIGIFDGETNSLNNVIATDGAGELVSSPGTLFGQDVAVIGDFDSDGYSDYAFGFDEDAGGDGGLGISISSGLAASFTTPPLDTANYDYLYGSAGQGLGFNVYGAGDVNRDGFDDIVVGTLSNQAYMVYGGTGVPSLSATIPMPGSPTTFFGKHVVGGSDINRDGHSDLLISSVSALHGEQVHLYSGSTLSEVSRFFTTRLGWEVNNAEMLSDVNGDGRDDFALSTSNGTHNEIFVIYGRESGFPANVDLNTNSFDPQFGMMFRWENSGGQIELADLGDINGDGLGDLAIGASEAEFNFALNDDGAIKVVYGHVTPNVIKDGDAGDLSTDTNIIRASANGQALLGNNDDNDLIGVGVNNISVSAGAGDDNILLGINGAVHKTINGGAGDDTLLLSGDGGVLDFSSAGAPGMTLSDVETIRFAGNSQGLVFDIKDIFELLQQSDTSTLRIESAGSGNQISFRKDGGDVDLGAGGANFTGELGTDVGGEAGFYDLNFGGYTLLIDTNVTVATGF